MKESKTAHTYSILSDNQQSKQLIAIKEGNTNENSCKYKKDTIVQGTQNPSHVCLGCRISEHFEICIALFF